MLTKKFRTFAFCFCCENKVRAFKGWWVGIKESFHEGLECVGKMPVANLEECKHLLTKKFRTFAFCFCCENKVRAFKGWWVGIKESFHEGLECVGKMPVANLEECKHLLTKKFRTFAFCFCCENKVRAFKGWWVGIKESFHEGLECV